MDLIVSDTKEQCGEAAAEHAARAIRAALDARGAAAIILATGASQFDMLAALVRAEGIDWLRVTCFHLDEYIGLGASHPASFRRYLKERFVDRLPAPPAAFHYVSGEASDPQAECRRLGEIVRAHTIDAAMVGIGENGHLAFNDPPADFETTEPYLVVDLDEACRRQQLGEGWFETLGDVPRRAISMSVRQIMASRIIICTVPDARKAEAVRKTVEGPVTPDAPASILQEHPAAALYLDPGSASGLAG
ncbi:MAG: glucosamine-6-phosphate deaminase [Planctomycetota bacterium]|nr:glucosamine-6-phosphate deaminase [Planctomycetota bacterium]